jgi:hypothetical protein
MQPANKPEKDKGKRPSKAFGEREREREIVYTVVLFPLNDETLGRPRQTKPL